NGGIKLLDFSKKLAAESPAASLIKICANTDRLVKLEQKIENNGGQTAEQKKLEEFIKANYKGSLSTMLSSLGKA
ncbi:hypothetical protein IT411_00515, partial [Candidatus Peregrinibacteria bacterium]|nr:hypothetical protein [Candidatus Peregrinibacteria bacterium]